MATDAALEAASDAELVRRIAASGRDLAAEAELCQRFAPRVRLYGLKHLRDDDRARELVQLVLVAMIEALRAGRVADPERFDRDRGEVLIACQRHFAAFPHDVVFDVRVHRRSRLPELATYVIPHEFP